MHGKIVCKICGKLIAQCRCIDCGNNIEYQMCDKCKSSPTDPYLAKAREMCPKKKDEKETCKNCDDFKTHGSTYCLDCTVETQVYSYNQAIDDCLPIVADLLKRVDGLSNSAQFRRVEEQRKLIARLESDREMFQADASHKELENFSLKKKVAELEQANDKLREINNHVIEELPCPR